MRTKIFLFLVMTPVMMWSISAYSHNPSKHKEGAEKPNCSAMADMEHSSMDMNDPVVQAMMKKCMGDMHEEEQREEKDLNVIDDYTKKNKSEHGH